MRVAFLVVLLAGIEAIVSGRDRHAAFELVLLLLVSAGLILETVLLVRPSLRRIRATVFELDQSRQHVAELHRLVAGQSELVASQVAVQTRSLSDRNRDLERRVREQAADLERSNQELQQFASVASHDLREPLRMVTSYLELLQRRHAPTLEPSAREFIGFAVDGAKRMKRMIDGLLEYARVGSRGGELLLTALTCPLQEALANLAVAVRESGAVFQHGGLPAVRADARQLAQLFQNLIANAIRHRGERAPVIRILAERTGEVWRIGVCDNGPGIAPEHHERIFRPFERACTGGDGNGLGLAICRKIVERHGGRLGVESAPGEGATFWFTLPAAEDVDLVEVALECSA